MKVDLCLAWNWEYDSSFVKKLEISFSRLGLTILQVTPHNLSEVLSGLEKEEIFFRSFFDRASDSDPSFQPLTDWACSRNIFRINPSERASWVWDKATMHLEFIQQGINTPHTMILPPFSEQPSLPELNLEPLGADFAIKPAMGGGGWGVMLEATSIDQVQAARQAYPQEKILLQAQVRPALLNGRPAWFRVLVCCGACYACWWDTTTHVYKPISSEDVFRYGLRALREVPVRIAQICQLQLFSSEIAITPDDHYLVTDYVNDPVDLRLQSEAEDGVPDAILDNIAGRLARLISSK